MMRFPGSSRVGRDDGGYVLPMVLGLGLVMVMIVGVVLTSTLGGTQKADTDQDWNAALAAAYAGVEDYQSRVENDTAYVSYGNPDSEFSADSTGLSLPTGVDENAAFDVTPGGAWAEVPGSDGAAHFRYEVDNSDYPLTGVIHLRATGRVGEQTRSVIADLHQDGFSDFVYFTDYEVQDPLITTANDNHCAAYYWARSSSCDSIQFGTSDVLNGKVHSNDRLLICQSVFRGAVTTASQTNPLWARASGCGNPTFQKGAPARTGNIPMPDTNAEMKRETRNDLPSEVPNPGCLYTGPTTIVFHDNGTMTVHSPYTLFTNVAATKTGASNPTQCGQPGTGTGQLGHVDGATIPTLDHNLVFVQNVPSVSSDANYWKTTGTGSVPSDFSCSGTGGSQGWRFGSQRYPASNERMPGTSTTTTPAYGCRNGDLYVKGTLEGVMTLAAENFVYITGDIRYDNANRDLLGIVGQNAIWIWNPMNSSNQPLLGTNRTIHAAMVSVQHTIQVQNWNIGPSRGDLRVVGSMAQRFRGTVGTTGGNGYDKDYNYDARLTYTSPPKYLTPTSSTYDMTQVAGVPAAFDANGAPR